MIYGLMDTQITEAPSIIKKEFTISVWTAMGILGTSIIVSVVGTAFTVGRTLNTDHFTLVRTADSVAEIKASYVNKDVYSANQESINSSLRDIKNQLSAIGSRIK